MTPQKAAGPKSSKALTKNAKRPAHPDETDIDLRLIATSDLHGHILPFDYYTGENTDRLGLARTASLIAAARAEVNNCLLFDNGDFLQGSPLGDYMAQSDVAQSDVAQNGALHPMVAAMNHLRYDAGTLGNHEFNFGLDFLNRAIAKAKFPIVTANVQRLDGPLGKKPFLPPFAILERTLVDRQGSKHIVKIGVIGFTPPQILIWDRHHLAGKLATDDIVAAARTNIPIMRAAGADLIIALSHSGIGTAAAALGNENVSTAIARIVGIDAVIAGHTHLVFPSADFATGPEVDPVNGTLCGKPAVMPGFYGSHLGVIDLVLTRANGAYTVRRHIATVRPIWHRNSAGKITASVKTNAGLARLTSAAHQNTRLWANRTIGQTAVPIHSFFALIAPSPATNLVAAAQTSHIAKSLANTAFASLPVLASVAPFKAGGRGGPENYTNIKAGNVKMRHAADLYIHPNASAAIRLTGAEILDWQEYAVGVYNQILPGSIDVPLINPNFPSFNFDLICGLRFEIDLSKPPRFDAHGRLINGQPRRIRRLCYCDAAIDPKQNFIVATNSYRIATLGAHVPDVADRVIYQSRDSNADVVLGHLTSGQPNTFSGKSDWRFAAMPGTTVTFDTSPDAVSHSAQLSGTAIEPIGLSPAGFLRFRLHL